MAKDNNFDAERYARQLSLPGFGERGQRRLAGARVLIVGAGGLGNPAGLYLAAAGVGRIVVSDFDVVDASNLPRQVVFRDADTDKPKAEVLALRLCDANPDLTAVGISRRLNRDDLLKEVAAADAVLDCTDNFQSRWLINECCQTAQTALVSGATIRFEGQLAVFRFDQRHSPCYRCLYSEADENLLDCAGQGVLAPVAGTVGTLMATETIKLLAGIEEHAATRLWIYDGLAGNSKYITVKANPDCPLCAWQEPG